jgi:hypothetical protein
MHTCPQCEATTLRLLGAIEKLRALTEEESVFLEQIIRRQNERQRHKGEAPVTFRRWTAEMDRKLMKTRSIVERRRFAEAHGLTDNAVYLRHSRLKRQNANQAEKV